MLGFATLRASNRYTDEGETTTSTLGSNFALLRLVMISVMDLEVPFLQKHWILVNCAREYCAGG